MHWHPRLPSSQVCAQLSPPQRGGASFPSTLWKFREGTFVHKEGKQAFSFLLWSLSTCHGMFYSPFSIILLWAQGSSWAKCSFMGAPHQPPVPILTPWARERVGQRVAIVAWGLGQWAAKNPMGVARGGTMWEWRLQVPGTCFVVLPDFSCKSQTQKLLYWKLYSCLLNYIGKNFFYLTNYDLLTMSCFFLLSQ